jgi:hypothetical protein
MTRDAGKVDTFIDTFGGGYVELALKLGVTPNRIDTIIDFAAAAKYGVKTEGNHEAATAEVFGQLAGLLAAGRLEIPIAKVIPWPTFATPIESSSSVTRMARSYLNPDITNTAKEPIAATGL